MSKYLIGVLIVGLATYAVPAAAGGFFHNVGNAYEKATTRDAGNVVEKAAHDVGHSVEKAVQDTGKTLEKSAQPDTNEWMAINGEQGGAQVIPVDTRRHKM